MGKCQIVIVEKIPGRDLNLFLPIQYIQLYLPLNLVQSNLTFPYGHLSNMVIMYRDSLHTSLAVRLHLSHAGF